MRRPLLSIGLALAAATALAGPGRGDETRSPRFVLRMATLAPSGSTWGKEIESFEREVERDTKGDIDVRVYYGGATGPEFEWTERMRKGQLHGAFSGGYLCDQASPSLGATSMPGLFQNREEANYVAAALMPRLVAEARSHGFALLGVSSMGTHIIFSRRPLKSLDDLRKTRLWRWNHDLVALAADKEIGFHTVGSSLQDAAKLYDEGKIDGYFSIPMAALAFQWYAQTRYILDLPTGYLMGCALIDQKAFDALPPADQAVIRTASAALVVRLDDVGRRVDGSLLGGIFQKQGLKLVPVSAKLRGDFFEAARAARQKLVGTVLPAELIDEIVRLLADYRVEHGNG